MFRLKDINTTWVIHLFALLHAVVTLSCRYAGIKDELFLTVLTITMILLICVKRWISIEFTAACVIMANIIGYIVGNVGAEILQPLIGTTYVSNTLSTIFTTELLGWAIVGITRAFHVKETSKEEISLYSPQMQWLLLAIAGIFILRIALVLLFSTDRFDNADVLGASARILSNSASLMTLAALNILYIRWYSAKLKYRASKYGKAAALVAFIIIVALLEAIIIGVLPGNKGTVDFASEFPVLLVTSIFAEITVYCLVFVIHFALNARSEALEAKGLANIAQYRYLKLKHQVNPHFLFNSLNILDCLVCEEKTEQASEYIHKLAGIYRYMLKTEEETLVSLHDELEFARKYIDLLKLRFPEGLKVDVRIDDDCLERLVVPCSLQLLIENATKHNAVNKADPLIITLKTEKDHIKVFNPIIPKVSNSPSTGLGLKYMKQQYLDLSGKNIDIEHTDTTFCVTIPLL